MYLNKVHTEPPLKKRWKLCEKRKLLLIMKIEKKTYQSLLNTSTLENFISLSVSRSFHIVGPSIGTTSISIERNLLLIKNIAIM